MMIKKGKQRVKKMKTYGMFMVIASAYIGTLAYLT